MTWFFVPLATAFHVVPVQQHAPSLRAIGTVSGGLEVFPPNATSIEVFARKRRKDTEERYPYEIWNTQTRQLLGVFPMPPYIDCGDLLRFPDRNYVVRRVTSRFKYTGGKFVLDSKRADATEFNRVRTELEFEEAMRL